MRDKHAAYSDILSTVIILAVVLSAGLGLWMFLSSYAGIWRQEALNKVGEQALVMRSKIGADYVYYPDKVHAGSGRGIMMLRNVGPVPVVIFRMITIRNGTVVYDTGIDELMRLDVGQYQQYDFMCPASVCREGDPITVQVHYVPADLFNPEDPRLIRPDYETVLFKVASFSAVPPSFGLSSGCVIPTANWVLVEVVDPKETNERGTTTDVIKLRVLNSSALLPVIPLTVEVQDKNGVVAHGEVDVVGRLPQEVYVTLDKSGLEPPLYVFLSSSDPELTVIPPYWSYPNDYGTFIDYMKLRIDLENLRVDEVILSIGYYDSGNYQLEVTIYDCYGNVAARGFLDVTIDLGGLVVFIEQYSLVLDRPVNILDVGMILIRTRDVTPIVTVTTTTTVTETTTATTTLTTTTTIPARTVTSTSTVPTTVTATTTQILTSTATTTVPSTTRTVTAWTTSTHTITTPSTTTTTTSTSTILRTTTSWSTTTRITTRTTTSYTTTVTTVVPRTTTVTYTLSSPTQTVTVYSTVTVYTSTYTSRPVITVTSSINSPTITQTVSTTTTKYTTTYTYTRTITSTVTTTKTVTVTIITTTTVTPTVRAGAGPESAVQPIIGGWSAESLVYLYLSMASLFVLPAYRLIKRWSGK